MSSLDLFLTILFVGSIAFVIASRIFSKSGDNSISKSKDNFIEKEIRSLELEEKKDNFYSANRYIKTKIEYYRLLAQLLQEKEEFDTIIKRHGFKDDGEFIDSFTTKIKYPSSKNKGD